MEVNYRLHISDAPISGTHLAKGREVLNDTLKDARGKSSAPARGRIPVLQYLISHSLNEVITEYGLTISVQKTESMAFKGRDPVRTKIVIDNKIIGQANLFNCLGNVISYEENWTLITN